MESLHLIDIALYIGLFLLATTTLQVVTNKISFPFTVALLVLGLLSQVVIHMFHLPIHVSLSPEFIYFFLLPALLFEAAIRINFHQFRLQFKTISFLATFGLLLSIFAIGFGLTFLLGMPLGIALLFGAIISATDPIAVLSLFKTLGAPKRLSLVADGESMFNDATGVIAFRVISAFVLGTSGFQADKLVNSLGTFIYVFIGSLILGVLVGILTSLAVSRLRNDRVLVTALTMTLTLLSFAGAEHFFHLSGVITTVMAGITFGNLGRGKLSSSTIHYLQEFWEYIGYLSLSLVFFFATFTLDLELFSQDLWKLAVVILVVLIARAISVYVSSYISNKVPFFEDEPDLPLSWQHILTWGGLRGVIPLVLVYSLPDGFAYKEELLRFTLATLLFTLFVNGLTIKSLLLKLKLHLPRKEEDIIDKENHIFEITRKREKLKSLPEREFSPELITSLEKELLQKEVSYKNELLDLATPEEFLQSLKLQSLQIERETVRRIYEEGRLSETVYYTFDTELDLQEDALEYPEVFKGRAIAKGGFLNSKQSLRKRLFRIRQDLAQYPTFSKVLDISEESLTGERYSLLRARVLSSYAVLDYLDNVEKLLAKKVLINAIGEVRKIQEGYITSNQKQIDLFTKKYPHIVKQYQKNIINQLLLRPSSH